MVPYFDTGSRFRILAAMQLKKPVNEEKAEQVFTRMDTFIKRAVLSRDPHSLLEDLARICDVKADKTAPRDAVLKFKDKHSYDCTTQYSDEEIICDIAFIRTYSGILVTGNSSSSSSSYGIDLSKGKTALLVSIKNRIAETLAVIPVQIKLPTPHATTKVTRDFLTRGHTSRPEGLPIAPLQTKPMFVPSCPIDIPLSPLPRCRPVIDPNTTDETDSDGSDIDTSYTTFVEIDDGTETPVTLLTPPPSPPPQMVTETPPSASACAERKLCSLAPANYDKCTGKPPQQHLSNLVMAALVKLFASGRD